MTTRIREYDFIVGPETSTLPTAGTPSGDDDTVTIGYGKKNYKQGALSVADITALKAIASADRADGHSVDVRSTYSSYQFDADSSATGDDVLIVQPTSGTGRWIRVSVSQDQTTGDVNASRDFIANKGGSAASADSNKTGLKVEASGGTAARIGYDSTKQSSFVAGPVGSESEVMTVATAQTVSGVKSHSDNIVLLDNKIIRLNEASGNGSNYIGIKAPAAVTANCDFVLPDGDGAAAQVLKTDGSKNLGWATVATVEKTITTTAIASNTTIGNSTADVRVLSHTAAFDLTLDNTFSAGRELFLINEGTAEVTLKANDGTTICTIYRQTNQRVIARATTPATHTDWITLIPIVSDWITATGTGSWTTNITHTLKYMRIGKQMEVQHYLTATGAIGTPGALTLTVPLSKSIDTTALVYTSTADRMYLSRGGSIDGNGAERFLPALVYGSSATAMPVYIHDDAAGGLGRLAVSHSSLPFSFQSGDKILLNYSIPIDGWTALRG